MCKKEVFCSVKRVTWVGLSREQGGKGEGGGSLLIKGKGGGRRPSGSWRGRGGGKRRCVCEEKEREV